SEDSKLSQESLQELRGGFQSSKLQVNVGIEKVTVINGQVVATVNTTVQGFKPPTNTGVGAQVQAQVDALLAAAQAQIQQGTGNVQNGSSSSSNVGSSLP